MSEIPTVERKCPQCNIVKPASAFEGNRLTLPLNELWCWPCRKRWSREWADVRTKAYLRINAERLNRQSKEKKSQDRPKWWAYHVIKSHESKGVTIEFTFQELAARARQVFNCQYCDQLLAWNDSKRNDPNSPSLDRLNNETIMTVYNTRIVCRWCNWSKNNMTLEEFRGRCKAVTELSCNNPIPS
jgi:hypothetical protein